MGRGKQGENMKDKGGRPAKYNPEETPKVARTVTGEGKTLAQLAQLLGVNPDTITDWQKKHPEFSVAIKLGREDASDRVERALFERAIGYSHPTVKPMVVSGGQGMGSSIEMVDLVEQYPPDTTAAMSWLKNKRPDQWKDKQHVEHSGLAVLSNRLVAARKRAKK